MQNVKYDKYYYFVYQVKNSLILFKIAINDSNENNQFLRITFIKQLNNFTLFPGLSSHLESLL